MNYSAATGVDSIGLSIKRYISTIPTETAYFVNYNEGDNTTGDGSELLPWKTIGKAISTVAAGATICVKSGQTYIETAVVILNKDNLTLTTDDLQVGFSVDTTDAAGNAVSIANPGCKVEGIKSIKAILSSSYYLFHVRYTATSGVVVNDCDLSGTGVIGRTVLFEGPAIINRCKISKSNTTVGTNIYENCDFNFCEITYNSNSRGLRCREEAVVNFNNCIISYNYGTGIELYTGFTGVVTINNCVLVGNGFTSANPSILNNPHDPSLLIVKNSLCLGTNNNSGLPSGEYTDGGGNIGLSGVTPETSSPLFVSRPQPCAVSLCIDDGSSLDFVLQLAEVANAFNIKFTWAANSQQVDAVLTDDDYDSIVPLILAGHEVASHSRTHVNFWSSTYIADAGELWETAGTPTQALIDEVTGGKADLEAGINAALVRAGYEPTYECLTFVPPYNHAGTAVELACKSAGYIGMRGIAIDTYVKWIYTDLDTFKITPLSALGFTSGELLRDFAGKMAYNEVIGGFMCFFGHEPGSGDPTLEEWEDVLGYLSYNSYPTMTLLEMVYHINGTNTTILPAPVSQSGSNYIRDTLPIVENYCLKETSPCIGTGTDPFSTGDGDQYDADGYMVWSDTFNAPVYHWRDGVDIGAYAYGGSSKVYNTPTIISGDSMDNYVFEFPTCPTLLDADQDNTIYDASNVPVQIDLSTFVNTEWMLFGPKAGVIYATAQDADALAKIDKYVGNT
jgi:peptidoglycan/xylan/chitin deacetylase (PgdA/CDA1 family)